MVGRDPRRVLDTFLKAGRLVRIPARRGRRLVILDYLAQQFEPGIRYTEPEVNERLAEYHQDVAALRRYLVDEGLLDRAVDGARYWRSGGTVEI